MKKLWLTAAALFLVVGCAAPFGTKTILKNGDYPKAYSMVVNEAEWLKDRQEVVQAILDVTGGAKSDVYFRAIQSDIKNNRRKWIDFYLFTFRYINQAPKDGLLTQVQAKQLHEQLRDDFEDASIGQPEWLNSKELRDAFGLNGDKGENAQRSLDRLKNNQESDLEKYLGIYEFLKTIGDTSRMNSTILVMRGVIDKNITLLKTQRPNYSTVDIYLKYVMVTGDHENDAKIQNLLDNSNLTRAYFGNIESIFPDYSKKQIAARTIKLDLKTNGDDFLLGEVIEEMKKLNDWLEIDQDAPRKINFVRLRLNEQRNPPVNNTETVSDLNFGTLLIIPRNASVLFDYSISEYSLQWNFTVQDATSKKSKNLSGNKRLKKVECRNMRYQNVFGGTGALGNFPNSQVQSFCQGNSGVDFESARLEAVRQIAKDVNDGFIVPSGI